MNIHDMTEEAYKNGYEKGIKDFAEKLRRKCHPDFQGFYVVLIDEITALEEKMTDSYKNNKSEIKNNDKPNELKTMDFPEPCRADDFRLLKRNDDIVIEFGTSKYDDSSVKTLLTSVRTTKELAHALSSSINRNVE